MLVYTIATLYDQFLIIFLDAEHTEIDKYNSRLKNKYTIHKRYASENRWPPFTPVKFTKLGYVIHKTKRTQKQTNDFAKLKQSGSFSSSSMHKDISSSDVDEDVFDSDALIKENVSDIFLNSEHSEDDLQIILVEGAPGVGKTMLLKEIAYLWATGTLLTEKKVVLHLSLHDHKFNDIDSPKHMFFHDCKNEKYAQIYASYFYNNSGAGLVILLDGLDENLKALQEGTFLYDTLISKKHFSRACIVITSRPHATIELQMHISYRVEVIGFTRENRKHFVQENLEEDAEKLESYLKDHIVIDTLCHIPLNLSIILFLFKEKLTTGSDFSLPTTQTELIKKAVEMTVLHNLVRLNRQDLKTENNDLQNLPEPYRYIFNKFCVLAYNGLVENKLMFTYDDMKRACPLRLNNEDVKSAWFCGLGLIQTTQFIADNHGYTRRLSNFVHFSVQELMAAWNVSFWYKSLCNQIPLGCAFNPLKECAYFFTLQRDLKNKFWKGEYINMWSLYIGLTQGKDLVLKHFLSGSWLCCAFCIHCKQFSISKSILSNKINTLLLYLCLQEAPGNEITEQLQVVIGEDTLDLSKEKLSEKDVDLLGYILSRPYLTPQWRKVDLSHCDIDDDKFEILHNVLTRNDGIPKPKIQDLSVLGNNLRSCGTAVAKVAQNQKIIRLNLSGNALKNLGDFKLCILLEILDMSNSSLKNKEALELFPALRFLKKLKELKLVGNHIGDDENIVDAIGSALCCCDSLNHLELEGNMIKDKAVVMFDVIKYIRSSTSLELSFSMPIKAILFIRILHCCCKIINDRNMLKEKIAKLVVLNISCCGLQDSDAQTLGKSLHVLKSLKKLDISENKISDTSSIELTNGLMLTLKLRRFEYDKCSFDEQSIGVFKMVLYLRDMSSKVFRCVPSKVNALIYILECIRDLDKDLVWSSDIVKTVGCVSELDLRYKGSGGKLNDKKIKLLCPLLKWFRQLEVVCLNNNNITAEATESLVLAMIQIHTFKQLEIAGNPIVDSTSSMLTFATIKDLFERKLLSFACNQDSDHENCKSILFILECLNKIENVQDCTLLNNVADLVVHLSNCGSSYKFVNYINFLPGLQCLDVSGTTITEHGIKELSTYITENFKLQKLDLSCNNLENLKIEAISDPNTSLKIARFNNCNVTNEVLCNLAQLLVLNDLDILDLEGNCFDSQGVSNLYDILTQNQNEFCGISITSLNLSNNNLNSSSAKHIIEIINTCKTKSLNVAHNCLDMLLSYFEDIQVSTLEELDISSNNQQTNGGIEFAQSINYLKNCKTLKRLNISNNCIDQDAVDHLYSYFLNCSSLEEIQCNDNPAAVEIEVAFYLLKNLRSHCVESINLKGHPAAVRVFISAVSSGSDSIHGPYAILLEAHASDIKQIDISFTELQIDESFICVLKKFTNLQMLDLSGNNITDETFKHVATGFLFASQLKITNIHLEGNPCDSNKENHFILQIIEDFRSGIKNFVCLPEKFNAFLFVLELVHGIYELNSEQSDVCKAIPYIEGIDIGDPGTANASANKEDFSTFVKLSSGNAKNFHLYLKHFKSLTFINIGGNLKNSKTVDYSKPLKIAIFNNCDITEDVLQNLTKHVLINNDLAILEISDNHFGDSGFYKTISACKQLQDQLNTTIMSLNLSNNDLTSISASMIMELVDVCKVKCLNISGNHFRYSILQYFQFLNITTLENLDISGNNRQSRYGIQFAQSISYLNTCKLKTLNISSNYIDKDAIYEIMCSFIKCVDLDELKCADNPAESEIEFTFDLVKKFYDRQNHFESITFKGYTATANAFISVVARISLLISKFSSSIKFHANQVREIDFSWNKLQIDESFVLILRTFSSLQVLNLSGNKITDEGFKFVATGFLYTSKLKLVNINLYGNPCTINKENYSILEMIEDIRFACRDSNFVCLPTKFKTFLHVLELVDLVNSEESDVCKTIFSMKYLNVSYSEIANSFSSSGGKQEFSRFVKLSSAEVKEFCPYLKHFKSLETLNMGGNNIKEDARDDLVTSILRNSSIFEIQLERNPLCKNRRTFKLFETIGKLRKSKIPFPFKDLPEALLAYVDLLQYINGFEDKSCDIVVKTEHLNIREFYQPQQKGRLYGIENVDNPKTVITGFVSHLKLFCNLRTLDLCNSCLTIRTLHKLSTFLCSSETLQGLDISLNNIRGEGALIILRSLDPVSSRALQHINMTSNEIEGRQSEEVATIICSVPIKIDVLKGNRFSEKSKKLLKAKKM